MTLRAGKSARRRRRLLIRLAEAQGNLCFHCLAPVLLPDPDAQYENDERNGEMVASYDHLVPRAKGGKGGFNLVIAHRGCNSKKGHQIPSKKDLSRLAVLNEQRKHFFTPEHGRISPGSFGEITSATIVLAEVLNGLDGNSANKQRFTACKFVNNFYQDVQAVDHIVKNSDWLRVTAILKDYHMKKLYSNECMAEIKNFVANVVHSIVKNRTTGRRLKIDRQPKRVA